MSIQLIACSEPHDTDPKTYTAVQMISTKFSRDPHDATLYGTTTAVPLEVVVLNLVVLNLVASRSSTYMYYIR
jgi:hypothetical protein